MSQGSTSIKLKALCPLAWLLVLFCLLTFMPLGYAQSEAKAAKLTQLKAELQRSPSGPQKAVIGIYLTDIYNINLESNTFDCIFWVWVTTTDKSYQIGKSIDLINAINFKIRNNYQRVLAPGLYESTAEVYATIHNKWNFNNFPYEQFTLKIFIEDSELGGNRLLFIPQQEKSILGSEVHIPGWKIEKANLNVTKQVYEIGFSAAKKNAEYSRANISVNILHTGHRIFIKITSILYLAFILCMCTYFVPATPLQPRLNLILGATFSVVGFVIILNAMLPNINHMLFSDKVSLSTIIALIVTLFNVLLMHWFDRRKIVRSAKLINIFVGCLVFIAYVSYNLYLIETVVR